MEFPLLNITDHNWNPVKVDGQLVFDEFIYVGHKIFNESHKDKSYCDCSGEVYKAVDLVLPTARWRKFFYFLPMIYKSKLIFEKTDLTLTVDQLKEFILARISEFDEDEISFKWIEQIKMANDHREIIDGQIP